MSIDTPEELAGMRRVGRLVARTLRVLRRHVRAGVTTAELDAIAAAEFARAGARSAPMETYDFPASICVSVNEEIVHGVPGSRRLRDGDLVKIDVTPELDGFCADAAVSIPVGVPRPAIIHLLRAADACLSRAMAAAVAGAPLNGIGKATEETAKAHRARPFTGLHGHGIGRTLHEPPSVPNVYEPYLRGRLSPGLVLAIEPMITFGSPDHVTREDGWTVASADGGYAAHVEHTVVVTDGAPLILTA